MRHLVLALIVLGIPQAAATTPEKSSAWAVRMLRIEGAAAGVRRAAEKVEISSKKISNSGYLNSLPQIHTELRDLARMVASARLAVDVAKEEVDKP